MIIRGSVLLGMVFSAVVVSGCDMMRILRPGLKVSTEGADQLIDREAFEPINLAVLLDPQFRRKTCMTLAPQSPQPTLPTEAEKTQIEIDCAFQAFYTCCADGSHEAASRLE